MSTPTTAEQQQARRQVDAQDHFGVAMVITERNEFKAQRDTLLAAAKVVAPFLVAMEHPSSQDLLRAIDNCKEAQP